MSYLLAKLFNNIYLFKATDANCRVVNLYCVETVKCILRLLFMQEKITFVKRSKFKLVNFKKKKLAYEGM